MKKLFNLRPEAIKNPETPEDLVKLLAVKALIGSHKAEKTGEFFGVNKKINEILQNIDPELYDKNFNDLSFNFLLNLTDESSNFYRTAKYFCDEILKALESVPAAKIDQKFINRIENIRLSILSTLNVHPEKDFIKNLPSFIKTGDPEAKPKAVLEHMTQVFNIAMQSLYPREQNLLTPS